jgi:4-amino-4-deoxy-L-arabinose transferase-like glycosyltransferase
MDIDTRQDRFLYIVIFSLAILVHLTGLLNDVFISDSALYASIAKEMVQRHDFLDLTFDGVDWLDKPHFHFWITALSYKIFGINTFAYKFPAILFTFLALLYTYKLARELYDRETALLAMLILATAEHLVISNNDVRAEPYLTGLIIASIYYYHRLVGDSSALISGGPDSRAGDPGIRTSGEPRSGDPNFKARHPGEPGSRHPRSGAWNLVPASLFAALAVMTKGIFTLIPIIGAVGGELIIKRNWKSLVSWKWILSLALITLFIIPELYALHHQFDSHPEKVVFGQTGVSGIRFFLWDSQIGRFFNTGPIKGSGNPFFFLPTLLWAFLPWSIMMYYAIFKRFRRNIPVLDRSDEFYTLSGSLLTLLVFSLSSFQLPHYTNIIFPLLAILTADIIVRMKSKAELAFFKWTQYAIIFLVLSALVMLQITFRPESRSLAAIVAFLLTGSVFILFLKYRLKGKARVLYYSCLVSVLLNFYLNLVFYPCLLYYQSGSRAAEFANKNCPGKPIRTLGVLSFTLHFNADAEVRDRKLKDLERELEGPEFLLFTSREYLDSLSMMQVDYRALAAFDHYHTTMVTGKFLNHKTRSETLRKHYLLEIKKPSDHEKINQPSDLH